VPYERVLSRSPGLCMIEITSADNPGIKLYQKLLSGKKHRSAHSMFTIEGARIIEDALSSGAVIRFVFIEESLARKRGYDGLAEKFGNKAFIISKRLENKLSDTKKPQGIYAICEIPAKPITIAPGGKYFLLCGIQDPGNMGTIIRTADALGLAGVFTVNCCDVFSPKAARSTMGSIFRVPVMDAGIEEVFAAFSKNGIKTFAAVSERDALSLCEIDFNGGCAVLIGNEGGGLAGDITDKCTEKITIRIRGGAESLNAAVAAGIIMYRMTSAD